MWIGVGLVGLWVAALVWLFRVAESFPMTWMLLSGLSLILLAAWPATAIAVALKRWWMVGAGAGLIVLQLVLLVPLVTGRDLAYGSDTLTVGSANVYAGNTELRAMGEQLTQSPPDVLVLEEFPIEAIIAFREAGLEEVYPHQVQRPGGTLGMAVYSRFELRERKDTGAPVDELVVDVVRPGRPTFRVIGVHVFPPQAGDSASWHRDLRLLDRYLARQTGDWIAIGDYNATFDHRAYRDLLDGGRRDAHIVTGRPWARSWPAGRAMPPFLLIDHAVLAPGMGASATRERTVNGSDHRMIEVDVVLDA